MYNSYIKPKANQMVIHIAISNVVKRKHHTLLQMNVITFICNFILGYALVQVTDLLQ